MLFTQILCLISNLAFLQSDKDLFRRFGRLFIWIHSANSEASWDRSVARLETVSGESLCTSRWVRALRLNLHLHREKTCLALTRFNYRSVSQLKVTLYWLSVSSTDIGVSDEVCVSQGKNTPCSSISHKGLGPQRWINSTSLTSLGTMRF